LGALICYCCFCLLIFSLSQAARIVAKYPFRPPDAACVAAPSSSCAIRTSLVCVPCFRPASTDPVPASQHQCWSCRMSTPSSMPFCQEFPLTFKFLHRMRHCLSRMLWDNITLTQLRYHLHHYIHYETVRYPVLHLNLWHHPTASRHQYPLTAPTSALRVTRHGRCGSAMATPLHSPPRMSLLHLPPPSQTTSLASIACGMIPACIGTRTLFSGSLATQLLSSIGLLSTDDGEQGTGTLLKPNSGTGRSVYFT
jgi:hypothetical protein